MTHSGHSLVLVVRDALLPFHGPLHLSEALGAAPVSYVRPVAFYTALVSGRAIRYADAQSVRALEC